MEESISLEEVVEHLLQKQEELEQSFEQLSQDFMELWLDHSALFQCMRNTGLFSRDMFTRVRRDLSERVEEDGE